MRLHGIYLHSCPNCGGPEDDSRLFRGLPCHVCIPDPPAEADRRRIYSILLERGALKNYRELYELDEKLRRLEELFSKATGSRFWSAQRTWAKRVLKGRSFAIIAPTGVGKTLFGIAMAIYFAAAEGAKSYIILPTTPLVQQVERKLESMVEKAGLGVRCLAIHAKLSRKERAERIARLQAGDFDVLVTTSKFFQVRFREVSRPRYRFVFVDDVDAVLKSSKSVDLLLKLLGFSDEDLEAGMELVRAKRELARAAAEGKTEAVERLQSRVRELESKLAESRRRVGTVLVVSSATGRPRGARVRLFRELLGFEAGSRSEVLRRIVDSYVKPAEGSSLEETVAELTSKLGSGGLVFVPVDRGVEYAEKLAELLRRRGVRAEAFHSKKLHSLARFVEGEVDVLVGVAVYYGVMVRGLDLPLRVRYAVFAGVPRLKFTTEFEDPHPINIARVLSLLAEVVPESDRLKAASTLAKVRRLLQRLTPAALQRLAEELRRGEEPSLAQAKVFVEALSLIRSYLARPDVQAALEKKGDVAIVREGGRTYILVPDVMTYVQASGRTSRLFAGGITRGLSVVVVDDERLMNGLIRRSRWVIDEAEWKEFTELDLDEVLKGIDEDRRKVREVLEGKVAPEVVDLVKTALIVVESPNKARTIASFFGRPSVRLIGDLKVYEVSTGDYILLIAASGGHVYDLVPTARPFMDKVPVDTLGEYFGVVYARGKGGDAPLSFYPVYNSLKRCLNCGHQFTEDASSCPKCGSTRLRDSLEVIRALQDAATEVDYVLIGTDPDTEGEKIGLDIASLMKPYTKNVERIEFHEVTRRAIEEALRNPRAFNEALVEAQIVRRVEDRWIGFTLSPVLWRVFWPSFCRKALGRDDERCRENRTLSAGRVQTPVLGWVVDRYEEYKRSVKTFYEITFGGYKIEVSGEEIGDVESEELLGKPVEVREKGRELEELKPPPPFTTDALITEASNKLRIGADEVMRIAQELFEMGFITYHRTDSTRISDAGIAVAREYLRERYGDRYKELFVPRSWGTGGAHEGIRPTRPIDAERLRLLVSEGVLQPARPLTKLHYAVYDLVFKRFVASQMKPGIVVKQIVEIRVGDAKVEVSRYVGVREPGFLEVYVPIRVEEEIKPGAYRVEDVVKRKRSTLSMFTQGDVVRLMKERRIGRPSTYAKIVQTLLQRHYVLEVGKKLKFLKPTKLGASVRKFLVDNFGPLVSEQRTRQLEEVMDSVEERRVDYQRVLNEVYAEVREAVKRYEREVFRN